MKKKITIEYEWWLTEPVDNIIVHDRHSEALEEHAVNRIFKMLANDYTSGELNDNIVISDEDGDGIDYSGWWSCKHETL